MMELTFGLASLGTGILSLLLALAVFLGNPTLKENRAWALCCVSVAVWGGGLGFAVLAPNKESSLLWNQIFYTGGVWIPSTFLWFVSIFTKRRLHRPVLKLAVALSLVLTMVLIFRLEWFVQDLVPKGGFRYWDILGPAYHVFTGFFIFGMGYSLWHLYQALKSESLISRQKLKWMFGIMMLGFLGGSTNFFYDYNINIPPVGQFLVFLYPLLLSWAIIRHQALDVRVLLRKTSLLLAIYIALIGLVVPVLLVLRQGLPFTGLSETAAFSLGVVVVGGLLSLGPFAYAFFVQRSRYFHEHAMAGITHDLKSPLAIIESSLDILAAQARLDPGNTKQQDYLEMIERNLLRLRATTDDLLLVMNTGGQQANMVLQQVDLRELCQSVLQEFEDAARSKNLSLQHNIRPEAVMTKCDPSKIKQVITNLLSNAIKFTDAGEVSLTLTEDERKIIVQVIDPGQGIEPKDLPLVFDRFYQGEAGRQNKGAGIGLAIAKLWVEAHGGEIHAESDGLGKGSWFWFTLPKS